MDEIMTKVHIIAINNL